MTSCPHTPSLLHGALLSDSARDGTVHADITELFDSPEALDPLDPALTSKRRGQPGAVPPSLFGVCWSLHLSACRGPHWTISVDFTAFLHAASSDTVSAVWAGDLATSLRTRILALAWTLSEECFADKIGRASCRERVSFTV